MEYLYNKGRIVTTRAGYITKILARPGQTVYDTRTQFIYTLKSNEYVVLQNELWIKHTDCDYLVAQYHTTPKPGFLVTEDMILLSTIYEKKLRLIGVHQSPMYNTQTPEGIVNEIIVFKKLIYPFRRPRIVAIHKILGSQYQLFELSTGEIIERGSLKLFYRQPNEYEKKYYLKKIVQT